MISDESIIMFSQYFIINCCTFTSHKARAYGNARLVWLSTETCFIHSHSIPMNVKALLISLKTDISCSKPKVSVRIHKKRTKTDAPDGEQGFLAKRRRLVALAASSSQVASAESMDAVKKQSTSLWTSKQSAEMDLQKSRNNANS